MNHQEIVNWLKEEDNNRLEELWLKADTVRKQNVGDDVHLRGLIEISNHCARHCFYCGLRVDHKDIGRYRMTPDEILKCAHQAVEYGYGTVVIQAGEDYVLNADAITNIIQKIKNETDLAITLSLGERPDKELTQFRQEGADRYLLRFETSNTKIFNVIHPPFGNGPCDRIAILKQLRNLGYEVGSGVMVGIPGTTYDDLANDIQTFAELDLDMIGLGPFIPHPSTPLGQNVIPASPDQQVPNTELMTYKTLALTRITCPTANIPSTTALATLNLEQGRELGLARGANVVMPNLTPTQYRALYEIYPAKACISESAQQCQNCMRARIESVGRKIGDGRGDSINYHNRVDQPSNNAAQ